MNNVDERTEILIVRMLDGEISSDEQLELDKILLRSPEARQLLDSYRAIDNASRDALATVADTKEVERVTGIHPHMESRRPHKHSNWMLYASCLAACLALFLFWAAPKAPTTTTNEGPVAKQPRTTPGFMHETNTDAPITRRDLPQVTPVLQQAPKINRNVIKSPIYIMGQDGKLYMMEVGRITEVRSPGGQDPANGRLNSM